MLTQKMTIGLKCSAPALGRELPGEVGVGAEIVITHSARVWLRSGTATSMRSKGSGHTTLDATPPCRLLRAIPSHLHVGAVSVSFYTPQYQHVTGRYGIYGNRTLRYKTLQRGTRSDPLLL